MTEPLPPLEPEGDPVPLNDATPPRNHASSGGFSFLAQMYLGFLSFWVVFFVTFGARSDHRFASIPSDLLYFGTPIFGLLVLAVVAWRYGHWPGIIVGALIGLGFPLLAWGMCSMLTSGFR